MSQPLRTAAGGWANRCFLRMEQSIVFKIHLYVRLEGARAALNHKYFKETIVDQWYFLQFFEGRCLILQVYAADREVLHIPVSCM